MKDQGINERLLSSMVDHQIVSRGISSPRLISALKKVPRHLFIPPDKRSEAFSDKPVPIGYGQTISQPYIVALMTEALSLKGSERVLEIGTGCGYQTAILSLLAREVFTIEIIEPLFIRAKKTLAELGFNNIRFLLGDGSLGWPEDILFDRIILTAAPETVPSPLFLQLAEEGIMIAPVGSGLLGQDLIRFVKNMGRLEEDNLGGVRFVPMTGAINRRKL